MSEPTTGGRGPREGKKGDSIGTGGGGGEFWHKRGGRKDTYASRRADMQITNYHAITIMKTNDILSSWDMDSSQPLEFEMERWRADPLTRLNCIP